MYVHGVSSSRFLSVWHTSTHTLCTESVRVNLLPFPPRLSPFLSPSSSPPSHSHLQPASTISSLHQKEQRRASHRGRGEGPADRIWSSSACGENDLEDSETESGMGKRRLEYPLFFQALIFALEWRRWDWKKTSTLWTLKRANERKSNAGRRERRTRKCIPAPSPELSATAHSSSFPPSCEPLSLSFLSVVPSLSFSPLPPPHAVACVHMRPYCLALFSSLSAGCSASLLILAAWQLHPCSFLLDGETHAAFLMVPPPLCVPP